MRARTFAGLVGVAALPLVVALSIVAQPASSPAAAPLADRVARTEGAGVAPVGREAPPGTGTGPAASPSRYDAFDLVVSCDEFFGAQTADTGTATLQETVRITAGGEVTLTLCSNPSTGFGWESPSYDRSALALVRHSSRPATGTLPGAAGSETWVFRALSCPTTGPLACRSSDVVLAYSQPWTGGAKAAWTFTLTVRIIQAPVIEQEPPGPSEPGLR
jgi:predicted secreted protein